MAKLRGKLGITMQSTELTNLALDCEIPTDKFKDQFNEEWSKVLEDGRALNALDACTKLGLDGPGIDAIWGAHAC